jgi:anthranilate 1,2-dioxygenase small subunit
MATSLPRTEISLELRARVADLYYAYAEALDDHEFERWPDFFLDECLYKVTARTNFTRGLPLGEIYCESKGMLQDRVTTIRQTAMYVPRAVRHFITNLSIHAVGPDGIQSRANFALHQTLPDGETQLFLSGQYRDRIVEAEGTLLFAERLCIHDALVVPTSLVFPI